MNGFTEEEIFLNRLAQDSFLKLWSWPNLFRDQGGEKGDGKEICDLTIVFGNDVIFFSDKKIKYNEKINENIAWCRWARKAIGDSVKQIKGARRWFEEHPNRVFRDSKCEVKIPVNIPSREKIRFHNVVVCHGIEGALSKLNSESSFIFDSSIEGDEHWSENGCAPFHIGRIFEGGFVHVFNESTIALVLKEFDTAKDFMLYLKQREMLLSLKNGIKITSESDIVQLYYEGYDKNSGEKSIWSSEVVNSKDMVVDKGGIDKLYTNPSFIAKKSMDKNSYFWDGMIENFTFHILNGSIEGENWQHPSEVEPSVRLMAAAGRFERRVLADSFTSFYMEVPPGSRGTRVALDPVNAKQAYLFYVMPFGGSFSSYEEYAELRRKMLIEYCLINKWLDPNIEKIIGIACKTRVNENCIDSRFFGESQDFVFADLSNWSDVEFERAKELYDEYGRDGMIAKRELTTEYVSEFPTISSGVEGGNRGQKRNSPCACGSGKRIKHCCGRL